MEEKAPARQWMSLKHLNAVRHFNVPNVNSQRAADVSVFTDRKMRSVK